MVKTNDFCMNCVQVITNPICPYCFSKHVVLWLRDKNISAGKMANIRKYLRAFVLQAEEIPANTRCIICGSKRVNLCLHCFTHNMIRILKANIVKEIVGEFEEDFETIIWRVH